ncbi:MAG TPA: hypothetical protein VJU61_01790 [Polyangiaceae bacterium]|nr:hypothetical protein [Polyangiaceae bacterium]
MKDLFRRSLGGPLFLAWVAANAGCTEEETGLFIQGNVLRDAPECIAEAEAGTTLIGVGYLDVGLKLDYEASLLVGNQLTPRGDKQSLRTETMVTVVEGAEVRLYDDTGAEITEFTVPASGTIRPDSSEDPGFGIINATLIPQSEGNRLANELGTRGEVRTRVAEVRVFGQTIGGVEVESAAIRYVIRVCEGCLVGFPPTALQGSTCARGGDQEPEVPCYFGQDAVIDCRLCAAYNPYCQTTEEIQ